MGLPDEVQLAEGDAAPGVAFPESLDAARSNENRWPNVGLAELYNQLREYTQKAQDQLQKVKKQSDLHMKLLVDMAIILEAGQPLPDDRAMALFRKQDRLLLRRWRSQRVLLQRREMDIRLLNYLIENKLAGTIPNESVDDVLRD